MSDNAVSAKERRRLEDWLAKNGGLYAAPEVVDALARCTSVPSLEFTLALLGVPGWRYADGHFENASYRLHIDAPIASHRVQLLLRSRWDKAKAVAIDVVSESKAESIAKMDDARGSDIRALVGQYLRLSVGNMPRALQWLNASFRDEAAERSYRSLEIGLIGRATTADLDWSAVPPSVRETRLRAWLLIHNLKVEDAYLPVLARCETTAEMRFLVPILNALPWRIRDGNRLSARGVVVRVQEPFEGGQFDFLIGESAKSKRPPFAIEVVRPNWQRVDPATEIAVRRAADEARMQLDVVAAENASSRGRWWADLLKARNEESVQLQEKFREQGAGE